MNEDLKKSGKKFLIFLNLYPKFPFPIRASMHYKSFINPKKYYSNNINKIFAT